MVRARADAAQVPGRAHQRLRRHRHLRRVDRRPRRRGRWRRRRWRRRLQPPATSSFRDRISSSCRQYTVAADGEGPRRFQASWTSTRTSSRRSPSCGSTSTAPAPPTWASTSTRSPTTCGRWSAAKKCRSSRTATISSRSCCASTNRTGTTRRRWATCSIPAGPGKTVKVSDVAQLKNDCGPASIDRYNRQRQISVNGNLDRACRSARRSRPRA